MKKHHVAVLSLTLLAGLTLACGPTAEAPPPEIMTESAEPPTSVAELIGSDASWGNTEGPAVDSKGVLYFTSRGTFKGIVAWSEADGASQYMDIATGAGPGGLWIGDSDNIYLTATDERQILKLSPDKKVSVVAEKFEADPAVSKGPNDIVVASDGAVYFTTPNGFDGSAPNGTVYRVSPDGKTTVFSNEVTGPNGIVLSADEKTLIVSHNTTPSTSKIVTWPINEDGTAGPIREIASVEDCVADGMAVDEEANVWLTCYSYGTAHLVSPEGKILQTITTEQKALTNAVFGRGSDNHTLYLTSSDMERVTGYVYRAQVDTPGLR